LISRPWHADEYMKDIVEKAAYGRGSPAQMIQHSVDLRNELKRISAEKQPELKQQHNLRAAKHRLHHSYTEFSPTSPNQTCGCSVDSLQI
jgi:hypothetical protein